jgi:hypothetical protein
MDPGDETGKLFDMPWCCVYLSRWGGQVGEKLFVIVFELYLEDSKKVT